LWLLLLSSVVLADDLTLRKDQEVLLTTTCIFNGQLVADHATITITRIDDNQTIRDNVSMSQIGPGVFAYNISFSSVGNYLSVENCYFSENITGQGSDNISVTDGWLPIILLLGAVAVLILGGVMRGFRRTSWFIAAVLFMLFVFTSITNIYIVLVLLFVVLLLFYRYWKDEK
jgi:hypothetical protein